MTKLFKIETSRGVVRFVESGFGTNEVIPFFRDDELLIYSMFPKDKVFFTAKNGWMTIRFFNEPYFAEYKYTLID